MRRSQRTGSGRGPGRSAAKERFWRGHIGRQAADGISVRAYCAGHGLSEPSFYAWRRELARRDHQPAKSSAKPARRRPSRRFVALTLGGTAPLGAPLTTGAPPLGGVELVHPRGHLLRIGPGCDRDLVAAILAALEQPSC